MVIRFRVSNFRSLLREQELSFVAYNQRETPELLLQTNPFIGGLLRSAAIYGANASGKSNLLSALWFFCAAVKNSQKAWDETGIPIRQFAGEPQSTSLFVLEFFKNGNRFEYGFEASTDEFTQEWLYAFPSNRKQIWFERTGASSFTFGRMLQGAENRKRAASIAPLVRKNSLFLSAAIQNNFELLKPIYDSIVRDTIFVNDQRSQVARNTARRAFKNPEMRTEIARLLQAADLGLVGYEVDEESLPESAMKMVTLLMEDVPESERPKELDFKIPRIQFIHEAEGKDAFRFDMSDESDGTIAYFGLLGPITTALRRGSLLVIDELETSLHPILAQTLVRLFNDPATNPDGAQLLFTTHATNLLSPEILRRDQVWLSQKGRDGTTEIFPMTDFGARKGERIDKGYLQGRFGAVPYVDMPLIRESLSSFADESAQDRPNGDGDDVIS